MGQVVVSEFLTVDGVIEDPGGAGRRMPDPHQAPADASGS